MESYVKQGVRRRKLMFSIFIPMILVLVVVSTNLTSKADSIKKINLSQEQMLLLANFVYLQHGAKTISVEECLNLYKSNGNFDKNLINTDGYGMNKDTVIEMLENIEADPVLSNLVAIDSIEAGTRAVGYVLNDQIDVEGAEAVLVIQGTSPNDEPWYDNLIGACYTDTPIQKEIGAFHKKLNNTYKVTNVTGHSKGGNLAQYVTITNGDSIRRCISFDGQGFSDEFLQKYKQNIIKNSSKILTIASYKEPVNILLNSVAGSRIYIKTNENVDPVSSHVSSILYEEEYFDKNGYYIASVKTNQPVKFIRTLNKVTDYLIDNLSDESVMSIAENSAPILEFICPTYLDTMSEKDVPKMNALYREIKEYKEKMGVEELTTEDLEIVSESSDYTVASN